MVRQLGPRPLNHSPLEANSRLDRWLRQVPLTAGISVRRFRRYQAMLAGSAAFLLILPWLLFARTPALVPLLLYPALLGGLPEAWLYLQTRRRKALIARAYPDLLAHLVTQTRAGAGTLQAFASSPPVLREPLRGEIADLIADLAIAPFPAALERFAERCDTPEIRAFAHNVIYQQSLGIALPEVLASEEAHTVAMAKQQLRQRIQVSAVVMASVTVVLLLNGLLVYFTPVLYDLSRLIAQQP
jgi:Flp pilus assembly protein TadB